MTLNSFTFFSITGGRERRLIVGGCVEEVGEIREEADLYEHHGVIRLARQELAEQGDGIGRLVGIQIVGEPQFAVVLNRRERQELAVLDPALRRTPSASRRDRRTCSPRRRNDRRADGSW